MNMQVLVHGKAGMERQQPLPSSGPISIGRDASCVIQLESEQVSRRHAVVWLNEDSLWVEDSSTNGTRAGERLLLRERVEVPLATPIVVGAFALVFRGSKALAVPVPAATAALAPNIAPERPLPRPAGAAPPKPSAPPEPTATTPRDADVALRREIHRALLEHLDLATLDASKLEESSLRPKVIAALRLIIERMGARFPADVERDRLIGELTDEAVGLGPLEQLLSDASISEIMVVDPNTTYVERHGKLVLSQARFTDDERVRNVIERIVTPLGRRIDESAPLVDARLRDGSRVNAVIAPLALRGACITIRKFTQTPLTIQRLIEFGTLDEAMARFLLRAVKCKKNIVISGGTGSGKTTLLSVLSAAIPDEERIVTIEDAAELRLGQPHVVSLETRPPNVEGRGEYTIRDLVRNALRMRPDRIVVGECRGGEALDMLQAMNTGHDGSLTTTHANSPREAIARLETLVMMAGLELPVRAIREQIAGSVHLIVQQSRLSDGTRKVTSIAELVGIDDTGELSLRAIFEHCRTGTGKQGEVEGRFRATGYLPTFLGELIIRGLIPPGEAYL